MSKVRLIEALVWKRRVNWLVDNLSDIGSYPNLFSTLPPYINNAIFKS
jgi:hypothetical protein